ncbi:MAG: hypothetical protein ACRDSM_02005, partial [Pseudonocardiaceae bacterium]
APHRAQQPRPMVVIGTSPSSGADRACCAPGIYHATAHCTRATVPSALALLHRVRRAHLIHSYGK